MAIGHVCVRRLPGEVMAPGCTVGRRQAGGGSVMLWAIFCWETLGPAIHVDVNLTRVAYLNIVAVQNSDAEQKVVGQCFCLVKKACFRPI